MNPGPKRRASHLAALGVGGNVSVFAYQGRCPPGKPGLYYRARCYPTPPWSQRATAQGRPVSLLAAGQGRLIEKVASGTTTRYYLDGVRIVEEGVSMADEQKTSKW